MYRNILAGVAAAALLVSPALAADKIKIGFITTLTTGAAIIGEDQRKAVDLAVEHIGGKMGPLDVEIVGLVRDAAYSGVKEEFPVQVITPRRQDRGGGFGATFYVRTERPPEALLAAIPRVVARADSNVPVIDARTCDSRS